MLDYSEDDVSLATGVQDLQALKPNYMAIKTSHVATRQSHETPRRRLSVKQLFEEDSPIIPASSGVVFRS